MTNWPTKKLGEISQDVHKALQWVSDNDSGVSPITMKKAKTCFPLLGEEIDGKISS